MENVGRKWKKRRRRRTRDRRRTRRRKYGFMILHLHINQLFFLHRDHSISVPFLGRRRRREIGVSRKEMGKMDERGFEKVGGILRV